MHLHYVCILRKLKSYLSYAGENSINALVNMTSDGHNGSIYRFTLFYSILLSKQKYFFASGRNHALYKVMTWTTIHVTK